MAKSAGLAQQNYRLFDPAFYLKCNPDVGKARIDPLKHYLSRGWLEKRDPHPLFDSNFYMKQTPLVVQQNVNPLVHYMIEGARLGLDPHPLFSTAYYLEQGLNIEKCSFNALIHYLDFGAQMGLDPHPLFDSAFYLKQCKGIEETPIAANPLVHYLTEGMQRGLEPSPNFDAAAYNKRYPDVANERINPLLHYVALGEAEGRIGRRLRSIADGARTHKRAAFQSALAKLRETTTQPFSHLIVNACMLRGGYERCACNFARAIAEKVGANNVLFIVTDIEEVTCEDWLYDGARVVNLPQIEKQLSTEEKGILILDVLDRHRPAFALSMNSANFLKALDGFVHAWKDKLPTKFVSYLGNYEAYVDDNFWGYIDGHLFRLVEHLHLIITDNERLRQDLLRKHPNMPDIESKVVTCYKSLEEELHQRLSAKSTTSAYAFVSGVRAGNQTATARRILWASRLDPWKQPELVVMIAERMPELTFDMYGRDSGEMDDTSLLHGFKNVILHGEYGEFPAIPIHQAAAFLYTSKGDSMPHVLIEVGACGLPIVTSNIGAIAELINHETGWLLSSNPSVDEYVEALRYVIEHPEEAAGRAANLKVLIDERHKWSAFTERLSKVDIWEKRI